jgi:hypothetical protein
MLIKISLLNCFVVELHHVCALLRSRTDAGMCHANSWRILKRLEKAVLRAKIRDAAGRTDPTSACFFEPNDIE